MGIEIERKFLVKNNTWQDRAAAGTHFKQAYLTHTGPCSVRVRIEGKQANINIKSATLGISRQEFEYPVPLSEAEELMSLCCTALVIKKRYNIDYAGKTWEIDVFAGANEGLIVAEIELDHADERFELPPWAGKEVSAETRYYNNELARHPFTQWDEEKTEDLPV